MIIIPDTHPEDFEFKAESGAEAIQAILSLMDLKAEIAMLEGEYRKYYVCRYSS